MELHADMDGRCSRTSLLTRRSTCRGTAFSGITTMRMTSSRRSSTSPRAEGLWEKPGDMACGPAPKWARSPPGGSGSQPRRRLWGGRTWPRGPSALLPFSVEFGGPFQTDAWEFDPPCRFSVGGLKKIHECLLALVLNNGNNIDKSNITKIYTK